MSALLDVTVAPPLTRLTRPTLALDLDAVAHNTRVLAGRTRASLLAVVKADGYGTGATALARTALAHGAVGVGVATVDEALALRADGVTAPLLAWLPTPGADLGAAVAAGVELGVASVEELAALPAGARVHLHLDTGLARDGAPRPLWRALCSAAREAERAGRVRVVGLMSHLACADQPTSLRNPLQRRRFRQGIAVAHAIGLRPSVRHLASTAAVLADPDSHHDLVRVGAGLLGIDPVGSGLLRPAVTLRAPLTAVRHAGAGTAVGYGATWRTPRPTVLGTVALGYADGVPRTVAGAAVQVGGRRAPVVGRVGMDQLVVDLGPHAAERPGDPVTVHGPGTTGEPTLGDWARWSGRLEAEVLVGTGPRVRRTTTSAGTHHTHHETAQESR